MCQRNCTPCIIMQTDTLADCCISTLAYYYNFSTAATMSAKIASIVPTVNVLIFTFVLVPVNQRSRLRVINTKRFFIVSSLSSARPDSCPRLIRRVINSSSGTSKSNITDTSCPRSASIFFNASAWAMVLGNPSK